jgi:hypothetical protein
MRVFDYGETESRLWDSETIRLIGEIHERKGRLDVYLNERSDSIKMTAEGAKLNTVEAANAMENIVVPKSRIKLVCSKKTAPQNDAEQGILGYFTAYEVGLPTEDGIVLPCGCSGLWSSKKVD